MRLQITLQRRKAGGAWKVPVWTWAIRAIPGAVVASGTSRELLEAVSEIRRNLKAWEEG